MRKFIIAIGVFFIGLFPSFVFSQDETLTITTYYPSPSGVYDTVRIFPNTSFNPTSGVTSCTNEGELRYASSSTAGELFMCQKDPDSASHALKWRAMSPPGRNCQSMTGNTYLFNWTQGGLWWDAFNSPILNPKNGHTANLYLTGTITADATSNWLLNIKMRGHIQYMKTNLSGNNQWALWRTLDTYLVKANAGDSESAEFGGTYTWPVDPAYRYKFRVQGEYTPVAATQGSGTIRVNDMEVCFD